MLDMGYEIFDVIEMSMHPAQRLRSPAEPSIPEAGYLVHLGAPAGLLSPLCAELPLAPQRPWLTSACVASATLFASVWGPILGPQRGPQVEPFGVKLMSFWVIKHVSPLIYCSMGNYSNKQPMTRLSRTLLFTQEMIIYIGIACRRY
jgi:hypothetical protein